MFNTYLLLLGNTSSESVVQHYLSLHMNVISVSADGLIELRLVLPSHMKKPLADDVMLNTATNLILSSYRNQLLHIFVQVGILSLVVNASPNVTMAMGENTSTLFYLYLELFECNNNFTLLYSAKYMLLAAGDITMISFIEKCIKGMFSCSTVSSPLDHSKRFTLHPLADLFIPTPTRILWEAFSHSAYVTNTIHSHFFPPLPVARYLFIQLRGRSITAVLTN